MKMAVEMGMGVERKLEIAMAIHRSIVRCVCGE